MATENKKGNIVKMNPVASMLAFNEAVKKENQHSAIWENFTINPRQRIQSIHNITISPSLHRKTTT
jgi:hypothetical protein